MSYGSRILPDRTHPGPQDHIHPRRCIVRDAGSGIGTAYLRQCPGLGTHIFRRARSSQYCRAPEFEGRREASNSHAMRIFHSTSTVRPVDKLYGEDRLDRLTQVQIHRETNPRKARSRAAVKQRTLLFYYYVPDICIRYVGEGSRRL